MILGMESDDLLIVSAYKENKDVMGITIKRNYFVYIDFQFENRKKKFDLD